MRQAELHRMRRIIRELVDMLPEERKNSPRVKELAGWSCTTTMHLVEINAQPIEVRPMPGITTSRATQSGFAGMPATPTRCA
jgi:Patatin phospholipase